MEIKLERIRKDLETLATFTSTPGNGVTRSSYSKEDQMAKEYLILEMQKIGLKVWEDGLATLFGRKEGSDHSLPTIMIGSHYDSVVNGGAFDGAAGTIAALEVMRVLSENDLNHKYPIEIIAMNAEEGETFGPSTGVTNSRALVGTLTDLELDTVRNRFGQTKREAMLEYGLIPNFEKAKRSRGSIKNFIEMHIEQGPILEEENLKIGLVEYLPGIGRYKVIFEGELEDSTARVTSRKDALLAAALFTVKVNEFITNIGDDITGSVNELSISPNSNQFVTNYVEAKVEIRTFTHNVLQGIDFTSCFKQICDDIQKETHVNYQLIEMRRIGYPNPTPPSVMNSKNVEIMRHICEEKGYPYRILNSGTGHDSMIMTDFVSTNMIYVPSKGGISHNPDEWTDYEDIKIGAEVLLNLVLALCNDKEDYDV